MRFRLMTYNVHACRGQGRSYSVQRVAEAIAEQSPDIVALQEVDVDRRRSGQVDQPRELAERLGMQHCFCAAMTWRASGTRFLPRPEKADAGYGNAVLSRFPIRIERSGLLPRPRGWPVEPRSALVVEIEVDGLRVKLVNTHLGLLAFERLTQIRALLGSAWVGALEGPLILCGDLNARPASRELRLLRARLREALPLASDGPRRLLRLPQLGGASSFPVALPLVRLDHVLYTPELQVCRYEVPRTALTRQASDHLPVVVDFVTLSSQSVPGSEAERRLE